MEFKEQSKKQIVVVNYEVINNGYKYDIEVNGSLITMKIYTNKETILKDGSMSFEQSAFPVGIISLQDGNKRIAMHGDIDEHIKVFNEFIKTL